MANPSPNIDDFGAIDDFFYHNEEYFLLITLPVNYSNPFMLAI